MPKTEWDIPTELQPDPDDYKFDLDRALRAVVGLRANVPTDAFTAGTLGTERTGNGVVIREDGLVLTIGYLVTEAEIAVADHRRRPRRARPRAGLRPDHRLRPGAGRWAGSTCRRWNWAIPMPCRSAPRPSSRRAADGTTPSRPKSSAARNSPATGNI